MLGGVFMTLEEKMNELAKQKMEEGKLEGIKENALRVAKMMKAKGYAFEEILELTGLTTEEVENL